MFLHLENLGLRVGWLCLPLGAFEIRLRIRSLPGDAGLNALFFHSIEISLATKEVDTLPGGVLGHFPAAVLASYLGEFLREASAG